MKLREWIEEKKLELVASKYRAVAFAKVKAVKVSKNYTTETMFEFNEAKIDPEIEIEVFDKSELTSEIDAIRVTFSVVKPRCRKPTAVYEYVKVQ